MNPPDFVAIELTAPDVSVLAAGRRRLIVDQGARGRRRPSSSGMAPVPPRHLSGSLNWEQVARGLGAGQSFGEVPRASSARVVATEQVRRVFRLAHEEARSSRAAALGSEHVLIAVLASGGDAARALIDAGATLERARACDGVMTAEPAPPSGFRRPAAGVRQLLREVTRRAISRGEHWLDVTGLLLAALADPDGGARRVLAALDVDVSALRARLERDAGSWQPEPRAAARTRRSDVG